MAWRSSGSTNEELVDNLVRNGLIDSTEVEQGFRLVDRKYFVPKSCEGEAYSDRPLREGNVHISAPHIYCTVLEALDLTPDAGQSQDRPASLSFLNIGSGSGYLTCIASEILGPNSLYYGIEIHQDTLNHCKNAVSAWQAARSANRNQARQPYMHFIHGNGLDIQADAGEGITGFDRIYAGAAINKAQLKNLQNLLCPGGVMVAPVDDDLLKVIRTRSKAQSIDSDTDDGGFITQIISGVTFAPLLSQPKINTIIPSTQWSVSNHHLYPDSFQKATLTILLCRNSKSIQPVERNSNDNLNVSASLPKEVWLHILSFTTRKWFEPMSSQVERLEHENEILQRNLTQAQRALSVAESRNVLLQRQNEMYLEIARQFHDHVHSMLQRNHSRDESRGPIMAAAAARETESSISSSSTGIHLSPEILRSTHHLLEQTQDMLSLSESMSLDVMMEDEHEDESESDEEMDEMSSDSEQRSSSGNHSMFDSSSTVAAANAASSSSSSRPQQVSENTRQIRTVSISSLDL